MELAKRKISTVVAFEGWDAGGKGGAIRRLTSALDPLGYKVNPVSAPNDIEKPIIISGAFGPRFRNREKSLSLTVRGTAASLSNGWSILRP